MKLPLILCVLCCVGCSTSDSKTDQLASAETGGVITQADMMRNPEEYVCRRYTPTGSHRSQTLCRSRSQIAREQAEAKDRLHQNQMRTGAAAISGIPK